MNVMRFFFNDTATTEIYTLSLHDALPIFISPPLTTANNVSVPFKARSSAVRSRTSVRSSMLRAVAMRAWRSNAAPRSEEHTSELQSRLHLVCRLLLEKKKAREDEDKAEHD